VATFVRTQSIEHKIGSSGRLNLRVTSPDVSVRGVDGGEVRIGASFQIRAASEEEADRAFAEVQLRVERGDGVLTVEEPDDHSGLAGIVGRLLGAPARVDLDLTVEMPRRAELRLDSVSGDLNVDGLTGEQRYNTVSGDLTLTHAGGELRMNSVSGDVTVRADHPLILRGDTVSGDLSVIAPVINELRANAVSGDVELEGQLASNQEHRIDTVSGDLVVGLLGGAVFEVRGISSDVSSNVDHRIEGPRDRRRVTVGDGGPLLMFNSMSGDLSIRRPRRLDRVVPQPPAAPTPPAPPAPAVSPDEQLAILQALERGEIDVDEATRRLAGGGFDDE
jgi:hypothetical protein